MGDRGDRSRPGRVRRASVTARPVLAFSRALPARQRPVPGLWVGGGRLVTCWPYMELLSLESFEVLLPLEGGGRVTYAQRTMRHETASWSITEYAVSMACRLVL